MQTIESLLTEKYLERFKVYYDQSLFPPDWELLRKMKCPVCGNKLKFPLQRKIAYCKGARHTKTFIITKQTLEKVTGMKI